ncbi:hypothetical protein [Roseibium sp.]|uniref:hypothetical protein n=1 Tax=Roseibium sp. TaxID=1936156 RepID=UPI003B513D65
MTETIRIRLRRAGIATAALALALALTAGQSLAQERPATPRPADLAAELSLSPEQTPVFISIMDSHFAETKALLARHGVDPSKGRPSFQVMRILRAEMMQNQRELETELSAVLTTAQMQKLKAIAPRGRRQ